MKEQQRRYEGSSISSSPFSLLDSCNLISVLSRVPQAVILSAVMYFSYLKSGANICQRFLVAQLSESQGDTWMCCQWASLWFNGEAWRLLALVRLGLR
uniref:Uncharacterized protein n=1 Tax=Timema cristinae TaxID=61476 RepID=A0A7R9HAS9_TIMCR|nr:unnamed protein product [Timema cristinae]